jgi:BRCA1/BRCA2-containing complex subunit 3
MQITCFQSETINNAPKKVNISLEIETEKSIPSEIRQAYITLPQSMYDEHNKEYTTVNQRICYNTNGSDDMSSLPQSITQLYNAGIYGKSISSLMDNLVVPTTHLLDLRSKELDKQVSNGILLLLLLLIIFFFKIKQLNEYKQYLLSTPRSQRQSPKEHVNKMEDFLIDL